MDVLTASSKKLVTVIAAGSSLNVSGGNAKVFAWYPGQAGGTALAELLFGEKNFSGHLPLTFYRDVNDLPAFEDYDMANRTYRYFSGSPLYPFGFGLSYTSFSISNAAAGNGSVSVDVCNTGVYEGDALVQVYVSCESPYAPLHPRLCGFRRISLKAGESGTLTVPLDPMTDTVINTAGEKEKSDHYTLYIGLGQPDDFSCGLTGAKPLTIRK